MTVTPMSGRFLETLPAGPGCERCGARTYVIRIEPDPAKAHRRRYTFECPRCYQLTPLSTNRPIDPLERVRQIVKQGEGLIERQKERIRRLQAAGREAARAEDLLALLEDSLAALKRYQEYVTKAHSQVLGSRPEAAQEVKTAPCAESHLPMERGSG